MNLETVLNEEKLKSVIKLFNLLKKWIKLQLDRIYAKRVIPRYDEFRIMPHEEAIQYFDDKKNGRTRFFCFCATEIAICTRSEFATSEDPEFATSEDPKIVTSIDPHIKTYIGTEIKSTRPITMRYDIERNFCGYCRDETQECQIQEFVLQKRILRSDCGHPFAIVIGKDLVEGSLNLCTVCSSEEQYRLIRDTKYYYRDRVLQEFFPYPTPL